MGGRLEIVARFPEGAVQITQLGKDDDETHKASKMHFGGGDYETRIIFIGRTSTLIWRLTRLLTRIASHR